MSVTLTEKAARRVRESISKRGSGIGVRLGVRTAGCSGLAYTMEFVDSSATSRLCVRESGRDALG